MAEDDVRFWILNQDQSNSVVALPFGDPTLTIVDEDAGGIVAYVNDYMMANMIVNALNHAAGIGFDKL